MRIPIKLKRYMASISEAEKEKNQQLIDRFKLLIANGLPSAQAFEEVFKPKKRIARKG